MSTRRPPRAGLGFTLVEFIVTLVISLFLVGAMILLYLSAQRSYSDEDHLVQLQDNQRLVLSMLTATLSHAGYVSVDRANNAASVLVPQAATSPGGVPLQFAAGEFITGRGNAAATGTGSDVVSVRYQSNGNDGMMDCTGRVNPAGVSAMLVNTFSVSAQAELLCAAGNDPPVSLADHLARMVVEFGVDMDHDGSADTYLTADGVAAASLWSRVYSVRLTLWFQDTTQPNALPPVLLPQAVVHTIVLENQP